MTEKIFDIFRFQPLHFSILFLTFALNITNEPTLMAQFNIKAYKAVGGIF